jgi:hypothetical protein
MLKESQKQVIRSIALDGPDNISNIQKKSKLEYQRTRRAIIKLRELKLLWLSQIDETLGPKAAQYYSLSPYGIVEAFINFLNDEETIQMINHWKSYTPHYVLNFFKFKEKGILKDLKNILNDYYPVIVKPWGARARKHRNEMIFNDRICIIHSHILDSTLFFQIFEWRTDVDFDFKQKFLEIVIQDPMYKKNWERWLQIKKFTLTTLETMYTDIKK